MVEERRHEIHVDQEDVKLLDDLIIAIDTENNKNVNVQFPRFSDSDHKIGKFSLFLRKRHLSDCYFPKVLSIGPCHANLLPRMHELKVKLAARFIETFGRGRTSYLLLEQIRENIKELKECFDNQVVENFNDGSLGRLLFVDGCAVLQFMHSYLLDELEKKFEIDNHQASRIQVDLFLLDNQIPFRVLELLVNNSSQPDELKKVILNFLHRNSMMASMDYLPSYKHYWTFFLRTSKGQDRTHLLDLLYRLIIYGHDGFDKNNTKCFPCCYNPNNNSCLPHFNCFRRERSPVKHSKESHRNNCDERIFRNLQELKSVGIGIESCSGLAKVSFKTCFLNSKCYLKLPPITVDEWTECKLMNLVAYEKCFDDDEEQRYFISSYIKLIDFLIDEEQDVRVLRESRTLLNHLSTDAKVAEMFNDIGSKLSNPPRDVYSNVKTMIEAHCESKCAIVMAQGGLKYFSSPWSVIGLFASILLLSLTAIQTGYVIYYKS